MTPTWQTDDGAIQCYLGDCREILPSLAPVDACVTDPPYGIGYDASKSTQRGIKSFAQFEGEQKTFDPTPFLGFDDVILFGCDNYCHAIPPKQGQWYFWDKVTRNNLDVRIAEGEFCWHKRGTKPRAFRHLWSGAYKASEAGGERIHPTQKPIALMEWCLGFMPLAETILDPFAGSFTTAIACLRTGRKCIAIELEPTYFWAGVERIKKELQVQARSFGIKIKPQTQLPAATFGLPKTKKPK